MYHFSIEFLELAVSCFGLGGADVIILLEPCVDCCFLDNRRVNRQMTKIIKLIKIVDDFSFLIIKFDDQVAPRQIEDRVSSP